MKWTDEAEKAVSRVPFFVRKKVRARVEKEAGHSGKNIVTLEEVKETQNRFLHRMESEVKGFQVDTCFGAGGCPNRAGNSEKLHKEIESLLESEDILSFLKTRVKGGLKFHHEFRITLADCPNACSQPQIKDIEAAG